MWGEGELNPLKILSTPKYYMPHFQQKRIFNNFSFRVLKRFRFSHVDLSVWLILRSTKYIKPNIPDLRW